MHKNDFITLVLGVVGGLLFSIGMCMCLISEWNTFQEGVVAAGLGLVLLLALVIVRCRKTGRKFKINLKLTGKILFGTVATLVLGLGMCMILVWNMMLRGILVGIAGIVLLLCLIPMCIGLK